MREAIIENPVINSAFAESGKHHKSDDASTNEIDEMRCPTARFVLGTQPRMKDMRLKLEAVRLETTRVDEVPLRGGYDMRNADEVGE